MDLDRARAVLRENHRAVLATSRADGRPQLTPVLVGLDADGRAIISSRETAYKVKNLRRDPKAALCVLNDSFYGEWVQVEGTAEVVSLPEALELLVDYYRRVSGEHSDWDEYRSAMQEQRRVLVRIQLERAGPDRQG
jgi:PPOX class probable F420-dependent enzyme